MYCTFSRYEESASLKVSFVEDDGNDLAVNFNKGKQYQFGECRTSMIVGQKFGGQNPVFLIREYIKRLKASVCSSPLCAHFPRNALMSIPQSSVTNPCFG